MDTVYDGELSEPCTRFTSQKRYSASLTLFPNSQYSGLRDYIHYSGQVPGHLYSTALRDAAMS